MATPATTQKKKKKKALQWRTVALPPSCARKANRGPLRPGHQVGGRDPQLDVGQGATRAHPPPHLHVSLLLKAVSGSQEFWDLGRFWIDCLDETKRHQILQMNYFTATTAKPPNLSKPKFVALGGSI